jgi:hypothetical protein
VRRSGGVEREVSYPYASGTAGAQPSCRAVADDFVLGLEAGPARAIARESRAAGERAMALHVNGTGPLAVSDAKAPLKRLGLHSRARDTNAPPENIFFF